MSLTIPVLNAEEYQRRLAAKRPASLNFNAFYSSIVGGVVTDPALMCVPIDDHMVHRGHAVFDTATITHGRLYRLGIHLDRFFDSAAKARIPLPPREQLQDIILQTCALSGMRDASVRYWASVGPGDIAIVPPADAEPSFYVLVFDGGNPREASDTAGIHEVTVTEIPVKPHMLATMKSNNYLLNALTAMNARDRGGRYGILVSNGMVTESCVLNVALVDHNGVFCTPPFDDILRGTTVRRAMQLAPTLPGVTRVEQRPIKVEELYEATELLLLAGDSHIYPVISLDGRQIGDGTPGPVTKAIHAAIDEEMRVGGTPDFLDIPYPSN